MKKALPTIAELIAGAILKTPFQELLDQEPPKEWLKEHPTARSEKGEPTMHLPIERVDYLLRSLFLRYWTEVVRTDLTQNSVVITVRLFVVNPITGKTEWTDGIGAQSHVKNIEQAAPIAESNAKKNAAKKLGRIFGRDISRDFDGLKKETDITGPESKAVVVVLPDKKATPKERALAGIKNAKNVRALNACMTNFKNKVAEGLIEPEDEEITQALLDRAGELGIEVN